MQSTELTRETPTVQAESDGRIAFRGGLPGFASRETWRVLTNEDIAPFLVLSTADGDPEVRIVVLDPRIAFQGFEELVANSGLLHRVDVTDVADALLLVIVSVSPDGKAYANLKAPIVVNTKSMNGVQLILDDASLSLRAEIPAEPR